MLAVPNSFSTNHRVTEGTENPGERRLVSSVTLRLVRRNDDGNVPQSVDHADVGLPLRTGVGGAALWAVPGIRPTALVVSGARPQRALPARPQPGDGCSTSGRAAALLGPRRRAHLAAVARHHGGNRALHRWGRLSAGGVAEPVRVGWDDAARFPSGAADAA